MSQKMHASNPLQNKKTNGEEIYEEEFEQMTQKILRHPSSISSTPFDTPADISPKMIQKRSSLFFKKKSTREDTKNEKIYEEVKHEKKVSLLKNYSLKAIQDQKSREDYFILFSFICLFGENLTVFDELRSKSQYLNQLQYPEEDPREILNQKEYISQVLISAAHQKEENIIKEIIRNDSLGYVVNIQVVLAFIQAELHGLLKPLLKVIDHNSKSNIKAIRGPITDNILNFEISPTKPLQVRKTLRNISKEFTEDKISKKPLFNNSVFSENDSLIKDSVNSPSVSVHQTPGQKTSPTKDNMLNNNLPRSAYSNVVIEAKFESVFPSLIKPDKLEIVDNLIECFGVKHINHLSLFLLHNQEKFALKYYKKSFWHLTESQIITLLNKKMWAFLCNIDDETDRNLIFSDYVFTHMREMLMDGKVLTELVLLFMALPIKSWKENHAVVLMELASGLLKEDPDRSRFIHATNPILTCALLYSLLSKLSKRFRFFKNDLIVLSQKMQTMALNLQSGYRENNLYALYLTVLPTGLTMLDYILQIRIKDLIETKFTKNLVLEFWDNDSSVTGTRQQISSLHNAVHVNRRFQWIIDFKPKITEIFSFQFGHVVNSAKYLLFSDLIFFVILYGFLDDYIYDKISFFVNANTHPDMVNSMPPYFLNLTYHDHPNKSIVELFVLINYWVFFLYRCIHIFKQNLQMKVYKYGYLLMLLFLTLTLLIPAVFPSYESQVKFNLLIKLILVFTRTALVYVFGATMLGFRKSGEAITIVTTVTTSLLMILTMLIIYMLFCAEIMENFFREIYYFSSVKESFFSLVEVLFGSITFINVQDVSTQSVYYSANLFTLVYAYSSTILATFLLIAYLSSIYEAVSQDASYKNTQAQYYYVQIYSKLDLKGLYSFPPIITGFTFPLFLLQRIPSLSRSIDTILLKIRFYILWVPYQLLKCCCVSLFYYLPTLYFKNITLIFLGKTNTKDPQSLHLIGWIFLGPVFSLLYICTDLATLFKTLSRDFTFFSPRENILHRVTEDDLIYIHRYETLKTSIESIKKENIGLESVLYLDLLNYLMHGWKISNQDIPRSVLIKKEGGSKDRLAELIKKHAKRLSGSKWLKNIYDAKKRIFREILDSFLNFKTKSMKIEDATLDIELVESMLQGINQENIVYLRARQIFAIQLVLLSMQSKEQISTMNKMEELEKKIDQLFRIYHSQFGEIKDKDIKWSRIMDGNREMKPLVVEKEYNSGRMNAILGTAVT